jgi:hypothetical protein
MVAVAICRGKALLGLLFPAVAAGGGPLGISVS